MKVRNIKKTFATVFSLSLTLAITAICSTAANASTDMNGVQGVIFGTGSPNYSITLQCNDLGWGFDDSIVAAAGGSFTINVDDVCLNGAFGNTYYFKVLDDGQAAGDPGYKQAGTHHVGIADETPIAITGPITVDPDTIIQIRAMNNGSLIPDTFTMHYVGTPEQETPAPGPTTQPLANTGFDSGFYSMLAGSLIALGFGSSVAARAFKRRK